VLDKVRKLLAKAEDPACTPAEAEALTAKAAALIAKYGIDQALLDARQERPAVVGSRLVELDAPYLREKAYLLHVVGAALRCRSIRLERRTSAGLRVSVHLFGFESDVAGVELLFASLLVQAARALLREPIPGGEQPAAWRRSWLIGFGSAVAERFAAAARPDADRAAAEPGTALVLADRDRAIDVAVETEYPNVRTGRRRRLSGGGFASGEAAGHRADLGGARVDASARPGVTAG
jgi:hypothetical protein